MEMSGEQRIEASRETVWKALNDPDVLKACIPGCQELVKLSDSEMTAVAVIKVGPVSARFQGAVTLSDFDPPNSYRITGEGQGGVAGFAKGSALVRLEPDGEATLLHYDVSAQIGGKLSQLGGRLIDATAKQMSGAFFKRFAQEIDARYGDGAKKESATTQDKHETQPAAQDAPRRAAAYRSVSDTAPAKSGISYTALAGFVFLIGALALLWYLSGDALPNTASTGGHVSADLAGVVQLIIVATIGYLFGRQNGNTGLVIHLDRDAIDAFAETWLRRRN